MKSVLVSFLMFAIVVAAIYFDLFEMMASKYVLWIAMFLVLAAFIFAFKKLGNPWNKDNRHE